MRKACTTNRMMKRAMTTIEANDCKCSDHARGSSAGGATSTARGADACTSGSGNVLAAMVGSILCSFLFLQELQRLLRDLLLRILFSGALRATNVYSLFAVTPCHCGSEP